MDLVKHRFLWMPLAAFLVLFSIDKLFFLPAVREHTIFWQKVEPAFYASREDLMTQLTQDYPSVRRADWRLGIIFGSSRAAEFHPEDFAERIPRAYPYNFSAPLACPAFHAYWLSRMLEAGVIPDFVVLEIDPVMLTDSALEYTLLYSLDRRFVATHTDIFRQTPRDVWQTEGRGFSFNQAESFFTNEAFALSRYPLDLNTVRENNTPLFVPGAYFDSARQFRSIVDRVVFLANRVKLGGIPNLLLVSKTPEQMALDAEEKGRTFLANYQLSPTQVIFFKGMVRELAARRIPTIIYWPVATREYQAQLRKYQMDTRVERPLREFVARTAASHPGSCIRFVAPAQDPRFTCRAFLDSHHLSGACFPQLTELLLEQLPETLRRP